MAFAILISSRKIPQLKDLLKMFVKGILIKLKTFFIIFLLSPLQSLDFLLLHLLTSINSSSVVGNINIELLFLVFRKILKEFTLVLGIFYINSYAILIK